MFDARDAIHQVKRIGDNADEDVDDPDEQQRTETVSDMQNNFGQCQESTSQLSQIGRSRARIPADGRIESDHPVTKLNESLGRYPADGGEQYETADSIDLRKERDEICQLGYKRTAIVF